MKNIFQKQMDKVRQRNLRPLEKDENGNIVGYDPAEDVEDIDQDTDQYVDEFMEAMGDDGAIDPSLEALRSDDVKYHEGKFWKLFTEEDEKEPEASDAPPKYAEVVQAESLPFWRTNWFGQLMQFAIGTVLIGVLLWIATSTIFGIQMDQVHVEGNGQVTEQEIISLSGIREGDNLLVLNEEKIKAGVENNPRLLFICVKKQLPHGLTLEVRERTPAAYVEYLRYHYVIDNRGMVLSAEREETRPPALLKVFGLCERKPTVGHVLTVKDNATRETYIQLMRELKVVGLLNRVYSIDISNLQDIGLVMYIDSAVDVHDNIARETAKKYRVRLGNKDNPHEKLEALKLVLAYLTENGKGEGAINVVSYDSPVYIPDSPSEEDIERRTWDIVLS